MKAAIVKAAGQSPVYGDFPSPMPAPGQHLVRVSAASLSQLSKSRASGTHYTSSAKFPFVPGIDGTGILEDGQRVYFVLPEAPFGSMAEMCLVDASHCLPLPADLDDVTAAAIANPGMSSWAALTLRAGIKPGETVLINGATGTSGRLAVPIAKHLGAGKVIATGRNAATLKELEKLGADVIIQLHEDKASLTASFMDVFSGGVDVVLDYLWGDSAECLLIAAAKAGPEAVPIRYVEIGAVSRQEISLPAAVLRSSAINLMGSGIGSIPRDRLFAAIGELLDATPGRFDIATRTVPLSEVQTAWTENDASARTVFTIHP